MDRPRRKLVMSSAFLNDMRHLNPDEVQCIMVEALEATYLGVEKDLGTFHVYGPGLRAWSIFLHVERTPGQPGVMTLQAEEGIIGA